MTAQHTKNFYYLYQLNRANICYVIIAIIFVNEPSFFGKQITQNKQRNVRYVSKYYSMMIYINVMHTGLSLFTFFAILHVYTVCLYCDCLLRVWQSFIKEFYYYYYYYWPDGLRHHDRWRVTHRTIQYVSVVQIFYALQRTYTRQPITNCVSQIVRVKNISLYN